MIKSGGNHISMTTIQGSWLLFDQIRLEGPGGTKLKENKQVFLRDVYPANYEMDTDSGKVQPLLVDIEYLAGTPEIKIVLDGAEIFRTVIEQGRYVFEAPMSAVSAVKNSEYRVLIDEELVQADQVKRAP